MRSKWKYYLSKFKIPFFILSFLLSIIGSYQIYHGQYNLVFKEIIVILYSVFKLFMFIPVQSITGQNPLAYDLAIWLAPASTMVGFFSVFSKIYSQIGLSLRHLRRTPFVVIGESEESISFIKNIIANDRKARIVVLLDDSVKANEERLNALGVKLVKIDFSNPQSDMNKLLLRDKGINRSQRMICFEQEPRSFGYVSALNQMIEGPKKILYLLAENYRLKEMVELKLDTLENFDVRYFSIKDLLVKNLLEREHFTFHPPIEWKEDFSQKTFGSMEEISESIGNYRLLIVGFSDIAEVFLNQSANLLTVNPLKDLQVTIADFNATKKVEKYQDYKTMIGKVINIDIIDEELASREMVSKIQSRHKEKAYSAALFASKELKENLFCLDKLVDSLHIPIAFYTSEPVEIEALMESFRLRHEEISLFGDPSRVLTEDIIFNEALYQKAKDFNALYHETYHRISNYPMPEKTSNELWNELTNVKKESSAYQAQHQETKKMILKKLSQLPRFHDVEILDVLKNKLKGYSVSEQVGIIESDPELNFMTALEHKRWNNFYYMRDFTYSEEKNEKKKTHDCLIDSWDEFLNSKQREKAFYDTLSTLILKADD